MLPDLKRIIISRYYKHGLLTRYVCLCLKMSVKLSWKCNLSWKSVETVISDLFFFLWCKEICLSSLIYKNSSVPCHSLSFFYGLIQEGMGLEDKMSKCNMGGSWKNAILQVACFLNDPFCVILMVKFVQNRTGC